MNIVQISPGELRIPVGRGGGEETLILNTSKRLLLAGHNVTILDRKYSPADPDVDYVEGVKVIRLKARRFNFSLLTKSFMVTRVGLPINFINLTLNQILFARQVKKYLIKADLDIIHVHSSIITIFLAIMSRNLRERLFYTSFVGFRKWRSPTLRERVAIALEGKAAKCAAKGIVFNDEMRECLITVAKVKPEHIVTVPVGIDTDMFNPDLDVGDVRQRYGLEGKFAILFVGAICQRKGIDYLIEAANIVMNEFGYKQVQFLLVGPIDGFGMWEKTHSPYWDKMTHLIEDYGLQQRVKLTGVVPIDDLRKLYAACDIFVFPSLADSTPSAPLEAMASGKPVIATKVQGMSIEVRDGQSGFLIDLADERQLAEKIKHLIDNPDERERMGAYGREMAEQEFGSGKMVERLLKIYEA